VVAVADRGIGIPADKLPHIFEDYYRTDEAVRHNKQSSGLGLAIVRHVAQEHGIRIRVESRPGVGTTFYLRLAPGQDDSSLGIENKETDNGVRADR
jgi:signal transduction histidine kinase